MYLKGLQLWKKKLISACSFFPYDQFLKVPYELKVPINTSN
jgi:hypothetical protein